MPVQAGEHNLRYLRTKRDRMGHDLPWLDAGPVTACGTRLTRTTTHHERPDTDQEREEAVSGKGAPELTVTNCGGPAGRRHRGASGTRR